MGTTSNRRSAAKKSLGQNFLVSRRVLGRIIRAADVSSTDLVIEVGPGRGILTRELAARAGRVVAIEVDGDLAASLTEAFQDQRSVEIVHDDARETDLEALVPPGTPYKVVANLPYYAASPIVRRFLQAEQRPERMVVMLQREVAENMVAAPGAMTVLSVFIQLYGRPRIVASVPATAFRPVPGVSSAVVRIDLLPIPAIELDSEDRFFQLVRAGFSSRRKQIHNSLRHGLSFTPEAVAEMLKQADVDPKRRAQTLSIAEWGSLYEAFQQNPESQASPDIHTE